MKHIKLFEELNEEKSVVNETIEFINKKCESSRFECQVEPDDEDENFVSFSARISPTVKSGPDYKLLADFVNGLKDSVKDRFKIATPVGLDFNDEWVGFIIKLK